MGSLPTILYSQVRDALLKCAPFSSQEALQRVFGDPRLALWKHHVPDASSAAARVSAVLAQFQDAWTADGQNALALFLCGMSESPERGPECPTAELRALSSEVQVAFIKGKIAECERELARVREHQAHGWSDPAYLQRRITELQTQIQMWKERLAAPPLCPPETPPYHCEPVAPPPVFAPETYTDLEVRIAPRDPTAGVYAVTAELDGDTKFYGTLQMGTTERAALETLTDPVEYGGVLFDALFRGDIHTAYTTALERARTQTAGRLRLRLWIDHAAADLHALIWERLHYLREGGAFRVATDAKLSFSRYFGLQRGAASAISGATRMLCVIANPQNLDDYTLPAFDVEAEVANLCAALDGLRQSDITVTIMPGRTGLSADQTRRLREAGYTILPGVSSLNGIFEALAYAPGYHLLHFVGHGVFDQRKGQAALLLEDEAGQVRLVTDADLTGRLAGLDLKPHLIFLAACESASRGRAERAADRPNPFVGLAPRLVQIGIPAVVAMQDQIAMAAAQTLTRHFYRFLLQHGVVDKALNQARGFLVDTPDWATPVLFMHLREGRLLEGNPLSSAYGGVARGVRPPLPGVDSIRAD